MSVTSWFLVSSSGTRHRLPREMIFVGRDECELMLQSRSVDKQHAVINYKDATDEHMVKDLGSLNGTFVNDLRIPEQTYITLKLSDVIRFGYAHAHVYILEKSQHKVPEEALKHEKYTSQLQLTIKALEAKAKEKQQLQGLDRIKGSVGNVKVLDRAERRANSLTATTDAPISRPTPLYGQPSWWGEDDDLANKKRADSGKSPEHAKDVSRYEANGSLSDSQAKSIFSYRREPSYFEIPTKESQPRKKNEPHIHEVPTKDTPDGTPTPPVVQSHASFTIEFDECTPGKMKIKDHVTKFSFRQPRKLPSTDAAGAAPTEVMSAESKVADWLVQSNASMMRRRSRAEDEYSTSSDPTLLKTNKANLHEDDAHSDSRDPTVNGNNFPPAEAQPESWKSPQRFTSPDPKETPASSPPESQSSSSLGRAEPNQAFVIEFFDDSSRKKRSQSFSNNASPPEPSGFAVQLEKTRKSSSPTADRRVPSSASTTPPTQRYTVPLKGPAPAAPQRAGSLGPAPAGPQRAGSLRREKTEERMSTGFSSRSSSSLSARPFSSVGRRSKLAKEFTAELLKQTNQSPPAGTGEDPSPSPPTAAPAEARVAAPDQPRTSSPIRQPVPLQTPVMTQPTPCSEVQSAALGSRTEDEDSLSDAGTYTIEADAPDRELEEERRNIDQVFGVFTSPEQSSENKVPSAFSPDADEGREQPSQTSGGEEKSAPRWMSCWASLADSYTESGAPSGLFDIPPQMEPPGGARGTIVHKATLGRHSVGADRDGSGARRVPSQGPPGKKSDPPAPSIHVHYDLHSTFDVEEQSPVGPVVPAGPGVQDGVDRLAVQDDVEPDSLSEASRSDDGSIIEQRRQPQSDEEEARTAEPLGTQAKSTSFYIGSDETAPKLEASGTKTDGPKAEKKHGGKTFSTATLTKPRAQSGSGKVRPSVSAPLLGEGTQSPESREGPAVQLIRQESFTKERPSSARLPTITSLPESSRGGCSQDTQSFLKDTEVVLAALEAKLQAGRSGTPPGAADSLSGESDVDTSSSLSQQSSQAQRDPPAGRPPAGGLHRNKSSAGMAAADRGRSQAAAEGLRRGAVLRRSAGKRGSTDLSDEPQGFPSSDQESGGHRKFTVPLQREDGRSSRTSQALTRTNSLSAPRPTRASMLRRARLGEASDNEGAETDRTAPQEAKQPQEARKLSRLDLLALPRRRTSSFNTTSDTEASSSTSAAPQWTGRSAAFSNRSTELGGGAVRRSSATGPKPIERPQKPPLSRTPVTRARSGSAKYANSTASSRRRQKGSDYTSTSDEEYDSNQSTPKYKRSQPPSASHSPRSQPRPRPQPVVATHPRGRATDSEDDRRENPPLHGWSNHSAEIARLSQDLANDLAILAREIHGVTGDAGPEEQESSAPVSRVTAHEQLIHQIPAAGITYQRVPPGSSSPQEPEQSSSDLDLTPRQQTLSGDEVLMDSLMLNPMSEIIAAIRENTEQLADKIKVLFQDRMDIWQEIEARVTSDSDLPVAGTANKGITSILAELRRVQRQLEVINTVVEPNAQKALAPPGVRASRPPPSTSRDFRTVHSASKRGGGLRPSESVRRAAVTPDDAREGCLV